MKYFVTLLIVLVYIVVFTVAVNFFRDFGLSRDGNLIYGSCLLCGVTTVICTCIIVFTRKK